MEEKTNTQKKIIIVDDDKFLLDMYSTKFTEKGFKVTQALGGVDAVNKLKEGIDPDVILSDVIMPAMDGFEFLGIIKNENLAPRAKIIILSNLGQDSDVEKARALGASGYVVKASVIPSEVVEKVLVILNGEENIV